MRRGRVVIAIILILVVGAVLLFFVLRMFMNGATSTPEAPPTPNLVDIVVVTQTIPQGAEIKVESLGKLSLPRDAVTEYVFTYDRIAEVTGKFARFQLDRGTPITSSMLAASNSELVSTGPLWASSIPQGQTAISLPVTRLSSVAYGVADGSHVNVIACMLFVDVDSNYQSMLPNYTGLVVSPGFIQGQLPILTAGVGVPAGGGDPVRLGRVELEPALQQPVYVFPFEDQRPRQVCQMIAQDLVVLKLGDFPLTSTTSAVPGSELTPTVPPAPEATGVLRRPDIITLILSPQDAITLTYMIFNGTRLTLTLRGANDQSRIATEAATLQYILSQYNIPVPAKLPYAVQPRIDILSNPSMFNDLVDSQEALSTGK